MHLDQYPITSDGSHLSYKFESIGPKGIIRKVVLYRKMKSRHGIFYNLSFGDWDEINGNIDDRVISNNYDTEKILVTVARTALQFSNHFPNTNVLIAGSTKSRTRLYQMAINQNLNQIEILFEIKGYTNGCWKKFKTGINFEAFLIRKK
jgi:hypothetical protein